jgi:NADH-quinone oxidoreductase subunit F
MEHILHRIASGEGAPDDIQLLREVANQIKGKCLCALGEFSIEAVLSGLDRFKDDFFLK